MTECGKHGKPRSRLSTIPTLFGNPFGITTFPPPRLLAYSKVQEHERPNRRPLDLKGVVTEVLGPKCNERSSTLTPTRQRASLYHSATKSDAPKMGLSAPSHVCGSSHLHEFDPNACRKRSRLNVRSNSTSMGPVAK
jgi:hypothetical protein